MLFLGGDSLHGWKARFTQIFVFVSRHAFALSALFMMSIVSSGALAAASADDYLSCGLVYGALFKVAKLEIAQQMAAHESARTTGLYDRRNDQVSLDEVERIMI